MISRVPGRVTFCLLAGGFGVFLLLPDYTTEVDVKIYGLSCSFELTVVDSFFVVFSLKVPIHLIGSEGECEPKVD